MAIKKSMGKDWRKSDVNIYKSKTGYYYGSKQNIKDRHIKAVSGFEDAYKLVQELNNEM